MTVSDCCGAATKVEYRPDLPHLYDDEYDLRIPVLICTKCGRAIVQNSIEEGDRQN